MTTTRSARWLVAGLVLTGVGLGLVPFTSLGPELVTLGAPLAVGAAAAMAGSAPSGDSRQARRATMITVLVPACVMLVPVVAGGVLLALGANPFTTFFVFLWIAGCALVLELLFVLVFFVARGRRQTRQAEPEASMPRA